MKLSCLFSQSLISIARALSHSLAHTHTNSQQRGKERWRNRGEKS